jgi:hypothetical protein
VSPPQAGRSFIQASDPGTSTKTHPQIAQISADEWTKLVLDLRKSAKRVPAQRAEDRPLSKTRNPKSEIRNPRPPGKAKQAPTVVPPRPSDPNALPKLPLYRTPRYRLVQDRPADSVRGRDMSTIEEAPATLAWACLSEAGPLEEEDPASASGEETGIRVAVGADEPLGPDAAAQPAWQPAGAPVEPLLVVVTNEVSPGPITVTVAPPGRPGFARATALQPLADGAWTLAQATVATGCAGAERSLVTWESRDWLGGDEKDEYSTRTGGDDHGNHEDNSAGGAP